MAVYKLTLANLTREVASQAEANQLKLQGWQPAPTRTAGGKKKPTTTKTPTRRGSRKKAR